MGVYVKYMYFYFSGSETQKKSMKKIRNKFFLDDAFHFKTSTIYSRTMEPDFAPQWLWAPTAEVQFTAFPWHFVPGILPHNEHRMPGKFASSIVPYLSSRLFFHRFDPQMKC